MTTRPIYVVVGTASAVFVSFLAWRTRQQARSASERAEEMVADGAMIKFENELVREKVLQTATRRATKWMSYQISGADHMVGQIGGISVHKRPLLTLKPDYVLKPLQVDHRGIREIAFYEAVHAAAQKTGSQAYASFVSMKSPNPTSLLDVVAFSIGLWIKDPFVIDCEKRIMRSWKLIRHEATLFHRLSNFIPNYFGVVKHETSLSPTIQDSTPGAYGISYDSYLLLQDATINFSKPCVIDIKVGTESYEPDAAEGKRIRERQKYPGQEVFGFRIVGMRVYDPSDPRACKNGFVFYSKEFGRSLSSQEGLMEALITYFGAGTTNNERVRLRSISSILSQLRVIQHWFRDNKSVCFYASSLLVAYEGNTETNDNPDMVSVKMIDFGRVRRHAGGDKGYRRGLRTIISLLEEILKGSHQHPGEC